MAISTYADLKNAVADWLERSDLGGRIPDFITLAESRLNRLFRGRMSEVNTVLAVPAGARTISLMTGFSEAISVRLIGHGRALRFVDPALMEIGADAGQPTQWTIDGGSLVFERPTDKVYTVTLRHLRKFVLSDAEPSNPILADYPDLYLFGALLEAAPFLRDADLLALFQTRFEAALRETNAKEHENRAGSQLRAEPSLRNAGVYSILRG